VTRIGERLAPIRFGLGFRWLLASSWVSNLGDGFALAAGPLRIASQTRDARLAEVFGNSASSTLLPMLLRRQDLAIGVARLQAGFVTMNQLVGPPVGAALFAAGMSVPFMGQAILVGLGAVLVSRVVLSPDAGIVGTFSYGWIIKRVTLSNLMRVGLIIETLTHLSLALTTSPAFAIGIFVVVGAHAFIWGSTSVTVRQRAVPTALQGRVWSVNSLGTYGGIVVGAAISGPIANRWGITAPFWFAFVGSGLFVILIWKQLRHIAHEDDELELQAPPAEVV
jgi:hypothetical protein